jgi:hypothetical protein
MYDLKTLKVYLERFKYPLLILAVGLLLMMLPDENNSKTVFADKDALMAKILSSAEGIGNALVLVSDKGVIVVCEGGDKANVRLEIIDAVSSYTGYSSDRITILKMHT